MVVASGDLRDLGAGVDVAWQQGGKLVGGIAPVLITAEVLAQLARSIEAPAAQGTGIGERAGVEVAGHDLAHRSGQRHVRQVVDGLVIPEVVNVAISELAKVIAPPAAHRTGREQRAGMEAAERELLHGDAGAEIHIASAEYRLVVPEVRRVAAAELAKVVAAPAAQGAALQDGAGVVAAGGDPGGKVAEGDVAERGHGLPVTEVVRAV